LLRHGQKLGERAIRFAEYVAQWAAEANHRVERTLREPAEVGDVEQLARINRILYRGGLLGMQLELSGRDVTDHHSCSEPSKLQREAPGARPRIQDTIAVANVLAEKPQMHPSPTPSIALMSNRSHSRAPYSS
jgi:hypothetical protein